MIQCMLVTTPLYLTLFVNHASRLMLPLQLITQTKWDDVRIIFFNLVKKLGIDSKMKTGEIIAKWGVLRIYENYSFRKLPGNIK